MRDRGGPVLPGATLGMFGGGQLGRMVAMAARSLGYGVVTLDPDPNCPAKAVVDRCITAPFDSTEAARELARVSDVITLEIEKVDARSLRAAAEQVPVRPGAAVLELVQDRGKQKRWLESHGFPVGEWTEVTSVDALRSALARLGKSFVKVCQGGYDGRGQAVAEAPGEAPEVWRELDQRPSVVEQALELALEISVMVARRPGGEIAVYPAAENHHQHRILRWSTLPGVIAPALASSAQKLARRIAESLAIEGLLAVEFFVTEQGRLLVNELAPRPHNSFHATERACLTSQFEQAVRAACDLPLGAVDVVQPAAMVNLLGDLWIAQDGSRRMPHFDRALAMPGVRLHLYGKEEARPGRKMGHLSAVGSSLDQARARALEAEAALHDSAG